MLYGWNSVKVRIVLGALVFAFLPTVAPAEHLDTITVQSRRGVTQPFHFLAPASPKAGAILFVGSNGVFKDSDHIFVVRIRERLVEKGVMVAIVDTPSDKDDGIYAPFRAGRKHAGDMVAVIKYLKSKADVPIWLIGTSAGTFSAASVAIKKQKLVAGMVLAGSVTRSSEEKKFLENYPNGIMSLNLQKFKKPVLILHHKDDKCDVTVPADVPKFRDQFSRSPRVEIVMVEGGFDPIDEPCDARTRHGLYGKDREMTDRIAAFIFQ